MSGLTPELAQNVITACQSGAQEIADAFTRCLNRPFAFSIGDPIPFASATDPPWQDGPGLVIGLKFGPFGFAAVLPESSGLIPTWYSVPDPTGESKLRTLAQELSMLLVPETLVADAFSASRVESLVAALKRSKVADDAVLIPLTLESGESSGPLNLIWPLTEPDALLSESVRSEGNPIDAAQTQAPAENDSRQDGTTRIEDFSRLPGYSRSLLRIKVPVSVRLASKKESIREIIELAPGSIIKFNKACDQPLHLYVGDREVAEGEAIKVGDYFGFRLSQMLMPPEHFHIVQRSEAS